MDKLTQWLFDGLQFAAQFLHPYLSQIAMLITVCLIALYANDLNKFIKGIVGRQHFIIRTVLFIVITAFGYGALTLWLTPFIATGLASLKNVWLAPVVSVIFIVLGVVADRKNQS